MESQGACKCSCVPACGLGFMDTGLGFMGLGYRVEGCRDSGFQRFRDSGFRV